MKRLLRPGIMIVCVALPRSQPANNARVEWLASGINPRLLAGPERDHLMRKISDLSLFGFIPLKACA
jgi:hypothetical protein